MRALFSLAVGPNILIEEWERLYAHSEARFFLSPAWIENWLACVPSGVEIGCVRVYDDLRGVFALGLVGVAPRRSFATPREARLHETGVESFDKVYLEYNDILVARDAPRGTRETAVAAIVEALPNVDDFVFRNAAPELVLAVDEIAERRKFSVRSLLLQPTHNINLRRPRLHTVMEGFSSSLRAKIRRSIRRYEERGAVSVVRAQTEPERAIAWTELMRLHAETWSRRGLNGAFHDAAFADFHGRLIERSPDWVDLLRLTAGEETIGVLYNFIAGDRVYNYQSGFRYEADNQLAPGYVCHALAAEKYREDGFWTYDLMGGDSEYKRRLGEPGELLETIVMTRPSVRTRARTFVKAVKRARDARMRRT
jgi:CelD/BcsL family acetyltransferase involved in cellulose biosynthesis